MGNHYSPLRVMVSGLLEVPSSLKASYLLAFGCLIARNQAADVACVAWVAVYGCKFSACTKAWP